MSAFGYVDTNTGEYVTSDPFTSAFQGLYKGLKDLFGRQTEGEKKLEEIERQRAARAILRLAEDTNKAMQRPYHIDDRDGYYHLVFDKNAIPTDVNAPVDIEFKNYSDISEIYNDLVKGIAWDSSITPISITFKDGTVIDGNTQPPETQSPETQPPKPKGPSYNRFHPAHVLVTDDIPVDRTKKPNEPLEENTSSIYAIIPIAIIFFAMT